MLVEIARKTRQSNKHHNSGLFGTDYGINCNGYS